MGKRTSASARSLEVHAVLNTNKRVKNSVVNIMSSLLTWIVFLGAEAISLALKLTLHPIMAYSHRLKAPTNPQYTWFTRAGGDLERHTDTDRVFWSYKNSTISQDKQYKNGRQDDIGHIKRKEGGVF